MRAAFSFAVSFSGGTSTIKAAKINGNFIRNAVKHMVSHILKLNPSFELI